MNTKPISYKLSYNKSLDLMCDNKILGNPNSDYPFVLIDDFLNQSELDLIYQYITDSDDYKNAKVISVNNGFLDTKIDKSIRRTHSYALSSEIDSIFELNMKIHQRTIEEFFRLVLLKNSELQALGYDKGFFYRRHSDNSNDIIDKDGNLIGFKLVAFERKITTVLFINSSKDIREIDRDFIGGELLFNFLFDDDGKVFSLKPKAGLLIAFPSCPHFSHEVLEVIDGYRITLVKWFNTITNF